MNEQDKNQSFSYTYSASEQEEIKRIRQKYLPQEADKMKQLRELDESVYIKGNIASLVIGLIGTLLFGIGMCCVLVWGNDVFLPGVIIGVVGIVLVVFAYPVYSYVTKKEKERVAPEIIRLTDELMK